MADSFLGEIRIWGGSYAPAGWAFCDGSLLPISEFDALFTLIGTTYGGDGEQNFALPNLQSRVPVHVGGGLQLGEMGGAESVTLTVAQIPGHNHVMMGSTDPATASTISNNVPASMTAAGTGSAYGSVQPFRAIDPTSVMPAGGNQPHDNLQPFLCVSFIISLYGIFPQQS